MNGASLQDQECWSIPKKPTATIFPTGNFPAIYFIHTLFYIFCLMRTVSSELFFFEEGAAFMLMERDGMMIF